jgi:hypothetical protein
MKSRLLFISSTAIFLTVFLLFFHGILHAEALPRVPSWIELTKISDRVIRNGLPATIFSLNSLQSPDTVEHFFRTYWHDRGERVDNVRGATFANWKVLSHLEDKKLYTLQLIIDDAPGTMGYLAVSELTKVKGRYDNCLIPMLKGTTIADQVVFMDDGQESRVVQLVNEFELQENREFYLTTYTEQGWTTKLNRQEDNCILLHFNKRNQAVEIVLSRIDTSTRIVVTTVQNS